MATQQKTVADLRPGDQFYWGKSVAVVVDIVETTKDTIYNFRTFSLELDVPARRWDSPYVLQVRGDQLVTMVPQPVRANPSRQRVAGNWSRHRELTVGQREEMEHTRSPRVARRIAQDHLREDPNYYEKLQRCGLVKPNPYYDHPNDYYDPRHIYCTRCGRREEDCQKFPLRYTGTMCPGPLTESEYAKKPISSYAADMDEPPKTPRENISADIPLQPRDSSWYQGFHGTAPKRTETRRTWVPGAMVLIGEGVDVGYKIKDKESAKEHRQPYVHEFGRDVKIYRRAQRGEQPTRTWHNFPQKLQVLGFNLGFSYADANGDVHEVKGSDKKYLAVTPSRKTLVVVGPGGVEFVMEGGRMEVRDWIYN